MKTELFSRGILPILGAIDLGLLLAQPASAKVGGICSNCHTMHNSQDGAAVASAGTGARWSDGTVSGGTDEGPQEYLTVTDCVGCHSNSGTDTIVTMGGAGGNGTSRVPIVFNMSEPSYPGYNGGVYGTPSTALAGGNFYWVAQASGDAKGHNVRGISARDAALDYAPGTPSHGCSAPNCHQSLTNPAGSSYKGGCQGCHTKVQHHAPDPASPTDVVGPENGMFRFLVEPSGHGWGFLGVKGIEDQDWEQTASATDHNVYFGGNGETESPQSLGRFCAGCHYNFHSPGAPLRITAWGVIDNGGDVNGTNSGVPGAASGGNPWLRHPTDVIIPSDGEYLAAIGSAYDPKVPVASGNRDLPLGVRAMIGDDDRVICISCHRAHGSPFPDLLRWDYSDMTAHTYASDSTNGCFKCHTAKDNI